MWQPYDDTGHVALHELQEVPKIKKTYSDFILNRG